MNLLQQFLSASQDFRDLMSRQEKQDERLKALENASAGGSKPPKYEHFNNFASCVVNCEYNGNASKGDTMSQGTDILSFEIDNSSSDKFLLVKTNVDMGFYDEVFLKVFSSSNITKPTTEYFDNPFGNEYTPAYLRGNIGNGASSVMFAAQTKSAGDLLGKIKLPNGTGEIRYQFELDYTKVN